MPSLVGVWRLVDITNKDADGRVLPSSYGPLKMGLITFTEQNRMMVVICDGREHLGDGETQREYTSYAGNYKFDGTTLVTRVDCSTPTIPNRIGTDQVRPARFEGNCVILTAPPVEIDGIVQYRDLTWEKIA
ncbi:lipocalin-like domain-containing protein [Pelagibacterium limicola]|uniref:lipocalin-like domain-containing protein n=1 Tax=Pelagibacterium limicola TaxID=2791022 RepID=UPI0018AF648B|nr:lipocalin-like domain-containing protein [Pelagibacterium limicola]